MIKKLHLQSFMLFDNIDFDNFAPVNLFIGENDTGKTSILKVLYSIVRGVEIYSNRSRIGFAAAGYAPGSELLFKLRDVFNNRETIKQNGDLSVIQCNLENNGKTEKIIFKDIYSDKEKGYKAQNWEKDLNILYDFNAIFIPPKEILSIKNTIKYSQTAEIKDFDGTYLDLVTYIENPKERDKDQQLNIFKNYENNYDFYNGLVKLIKEDEGKRARAVFIKKDVHYEIDNVAEGIRKLGIFPILEKVGYLTKKTILFIDEPENSIHPKALRELMRFLTDISKEGVQIFVASHSQFTVQQLRNIAKKDKYSIQCYSLLKERDNIVCKQFDLKDEMAENPILDEAIKMFDDSVENG